MQQKVAILHNPEVLRVAILPWISSPVASAEFRSVMYRVLGCAMSGYPPPDLAHLFVHRVVPKERRLDRVTCIALRRIVTVNPTLARLVREYTLAFGSVTSRVMLAL